MELIRRTREIITAHLSLCARPAVACSFGKDSMVLLALVREQSPHVPVLYFEGLPHPTKHAFVQEIASQWRLNLLSPPPVFTDVIAKDGHVALLRVYEMSKGKVVTLPVESVDDYVPIASSQCALAALFAPSPVIPEMGFDGVFIGHRGDDVDPIYGEIPLASDAATVDGFRYLYPLRDWTEADIWRASDILGIPQNLARYEQRDMDANNDYYPLCTECLKPSNKDTAFCPQLGRDVPNRGNEMDLYGRREAWRQTFVNIDRREQQQLVG